MINEGNENRFLVTDPAVQRDISPWWLVLLFSGVAVLTLVMRFVADEPSGNPMGFWISFALSMAALTAFTVWCFKTQKSVVDNYVELTGEALVLNTPYYDATIPYTLIAAVEGKDDFSPQDFARDTFSWYGRVPIRGRHVAVRTSKRVRFGFRFWATVFRFEVADHRGFIERLRQQLLIYPSFDPFATV